MKVFPYRTMKESGPGGQVSRRTTAVGKQTDGNYTALSAEQITALNARKKTILGASEIAWDTVPRVEKWYTDSSADTSTMTNPGILPNLLVARDGEYNYIIDEWVGKSEGNWAINMSEDERLAYFIEWEVWLGGFMELYPLYPPDKPNQIQGFHGSIKYKLRYDKRRR